MSRKKEREREQFGNLISLMFRGSSHFQNTEYPENIRVHVTSLVKRIVRSICIRFYEIHSGEEGESRGVKYFYHRSMRQVECDIAGGAIIKACAHAARPLRPFAPSPPRSLTPVLARATPFDPPLHMYN